MQSDVNPIPDADTVIVEPKKKVSPLWLWSHILFFLVGMGLLVWLIYAYWGQVRDSIVNVGAGVLVVIALNLLRHFGRAFSMYMAVSPDHRNFKYRSALLARFGGEAETFFTFTGPFLGDATKAMLLKRNTPITQSASAVIIDNILYYITVVMMVLTGVAVLVAKFGTTGSTMNKVLLAIVGVAIVLFVVFALAVVKRPEPFSHVLRFLDKRHWAPKFITKQADGIRDVEKNVFQFYHTRPRDFFLCFFTSVAVHMVSVLEVWFVLGFLGEERNIANAFIIESLTKVINAVFGFIPGTIGVYEGGNGLILKTLHLGTAQGVALALVRRAAILAATAIGCIVLLWRTAEGGAKRIKQKRENA
jgi:uncharacterized protein (TIRG00374 family)